MSFDLGWDIHGMRGYYRGFSAFSRCGVTAVHSSCRPSGAGWHYCRAAPTQRLTNQRAPCEFSHRLRQHTGKTSPRRISGIIASYSLRHHLSLSHSFSVALTRSVILWLQCMWQKSLSMTSSAIITQRLEIMKFPVHKHRGECPLSHSLYHRIQAGSSPGFRNWVPIVRTSRIWPLPGTVS